MKKIYVISEENHPDIGITETFKNAIKFLFENNWLDKFTEYFVGADYFSVWIVLDFNDIDDFNYETFMEKMKNKNEEEIIDFLENCGIYIRQEEIWKPKRL